MGTEKRERKCDLTECGSKLVKENVKVPLLITAKSQTRRLLICNTKDLGTYAY